MQSPFLFSNSAFDNSPNCSSEDSPRMPSHYTADSRRRKKEAGRRDKVLGSYTKRLPRRNQAAERSPAFQCETAEGFTGMLQGLVSGDRYSLHMTTRATLGLHIRPGPTLHPACHHTPFNFLFPASHQKGQNWGVHGCVMCKIAMS